jgi:hypothetical protein
LLAAACVFVFENAHVNGPYVLQQHFQLKQFEMKTASPTKIPAGTQKISDAPL